MTKIDWMQATAEQRKRLYQVILRVEGITGMSPLAQMEAAAGRSINLTAKIPHQSAQWPHETNPRGFSLWMAGEASR